MNWTMTERASTPEADMHGLSSLLALSTKLGLGLLAATLAVVVGRLMPWPVDLVWRTTTLDLLVIGAAASAAGVVAGLTSLTLIMLYDMIAFVAPGTSQAEADLTWLPALAIIALSMIGIVAWMRRSADDVERELLGTRALLTGATHRLEAAMENQRLAAYYDHSTDLPSRRMVIDRFPQMIAQARRNQTKVAVMLLHFPLLKEVSEALGHDAAVEALRQLGGRIAQVVRREDTVGRLDTDMFVVLLTGVTDAAAVATAAEKIAAALALPIPVGQPPRDAYLAATIGSAVFPVDGEDWEDLHRFAKEAMRLNRRAA